MKGLRGIVLLLAAIGAGVAIGWAVVTFGTSPPTEDQATGSSPHPVAMTATGAEACLAGGEASAGPPRIPDKPVLRVEVGEHIGAIRALAVAASGKTLVTGGWDKSVRLWSLFDVDGTALREPKLRDVLRVPTAAGRTGEAYAVALSPDEGTVAVGGRMSNEDAPDRERIYLFDVSTARVTGVLPIAQQVSALAFSPDGKYLAAGAAAGNVGLCVWATDSWKLAGHDRSYGGRIRGLAFSGDGKLAVASEDGGVRIYDGGFSAPRAKVEQPASGSGHKPWGIAFSPNGKLVAVGYYDAPYLTLHDAADPARRTVLQAAAASDPELVYPFVAWSRDGKAVFGGGSAVDVPGSPLARTVFQQWSIDEATAVGAQSAAARIVEVGTASGQIQALSASGSGGAAFVTRNGDILGTGATGDVAFARAPARIDWRVADWTTSARDFRISRDGSRVAVRLHDGRQVRFDLGQRNRTAAPFLSAGAGAVDAGLSGPSLRVAGKTVSLKSPGAPVLEGGAEPVDLWLNEGERAASFAGGTTAQAFALGTNHNIHVFNDAGESRARTDIPETAHRIAITEDGRLVVAAIGDGTLRWYKIVKDPNKTNWDLIEVLAVYLHSDGQRWIAWTPAGYYDASTDAEELINWQVNRGPDKSGLSFSAGRFRAIYWRTDVIDGALVKAEVGPDPSVLLAKAPPVLRVTNWSQLENRRLRVGYELEWLSQAKQQTPDVFGIIEGASLPAGRGLEAVENRQVVYIDVPAGSGRRRVQLFARTLDRADSDPVILELPALAATPVVERNLRALVVGVSKYAQGSGIRSLDYADDDARDLADLLRRQAGPNKLYKSVSVKLLIDDTATRANIVRALEEFAAGPNDLAVLFLAGHGTAQRLGTDVADGQTSLFLPHDAKAEGGRVVPETAISVQELAKPFFQIQARKLVFMDACRSGNLARNNTNLLANALRNNRDDVALWSAATAQQLALESKDYLGGHGAFAASLIEALRGVSDFKGPSLSKPDRFSDSELTPWLQKRVPQFVGLDRDGDPLQTPRASLESDGKPIFVFESNPDAGTR